MKKSRGRELASITIAATWRLNLKMPMKGLTLKNHGIRLSKLHLSSALSAKPTHQNLEKLKDFIEPVYLHQVAMGKNGNVLDASRIWIWRLRPKHRVSSHS